MDLEITTRIQEACDNDKYVCGIFVVFRKAFDTINHNILPDKLIHMELEELKIKTYLTESNM